MQKLYNRALNDMIQKYLFILCLSQFMPLDFSFMLYKIRKGSVIYVLSEEVVINLTHQVQVPRYSKLFTF